MTFGERITELREEMGFHTRKSFAEKLGIPETTLRNYETNAREPGHTFLKQISDLFEVSTDYLLGLTNEKERLSTHQLKESEYKHIEKYRTLDIHGKKVVDFILNEEWTRSTEATKNLIHITEYIEKDNIPNAAHKRTDIPEDELTPEMQKIDDDIMNDENF